MRIHAISPQATPVIHHGALIKEVWKYITPYRGRFILASLIRLAGDIAWLYPAFAFASMITFLSHYRMGQSLQPLWFILFLWFCAILARNLSQFFSKWIGYQVSERVAADATLKTIQHLFLLDMAWQEKENSGNKIKKIQNAADGFNKLIRLWFNNVIEIGVNLIAINLIIARFDLWVLAALMIFMASYFLISRYLTRKTGVASYRVNAQEEVLNGLLFEAINNIRTVKVMALATTLSRIVSEEMHLLLQKLGIRIFWYQSRNASLTFWAHLCKISLVGLIIYGIIQGHYEVSFLILFNSYFSDLRASIDELSTASLDFVTSAQSITRMQAILDEPIVLDNDAQKQPFPSQWQQMQVQNLSFSYGETPVLHNLSFTVNRGEKIGIVGLSGAGKSTLFKLLLKERAPQEGAILFDSVSLQSIQKQDYFQHVSVVLQETEVFNFSLKNNIILTAPDKLHHEQRLAQCLQTAHLTDLIPKLPQGLDTFIGEKGIKLSGGEKQRLGIARAVFKQPSILFLDEATSHLDLESEEKIQASLTLFFKQVTAIVIAHRLSTIKAMDKILVLENGHIIESGNFETLYAKRGRFYELWEKQKL